MASPLVNMQGIGMNANRREVSWHHFDTQRKEGVFCDVTFKCDGGEVSAHKCVLASVSEYFRTLFTSPISHASSTNVVVFEQFSFEAMTMLLDIVYSQADITVAYIVELLRLADYVQMNWLVEVLVENVRLLIDEDNFRDLHELARELRIGKLQFLCECFERENVGTLQSPEIGFNVKVFDSQLTEDQKREVAVIRLSSNEEEILLDPALNNMLVLDDDEQVERFWSRKGRLVTSFVHQNVFFLITCEKRIKGMDEWMEEWMDVYILWRFYHASKTLGLVREFLSTEINSLFGDDIEEDFHITRMVYNGMDSLYFEGFGDFLYDCVFKFDLRNSRFHPGYIHNSSNFILHMAYLKDLGLCWVSPDYVFQLEKYDFHMKGILDVDSLPRIDIDDQVTENGVVIPTENLGWESWNPISIEGTFYCLLNRIMLDSDSDDYWELILKLNIETQCWDLCSSRKLNGDYYRYLFHCSSRLLLVWGEGRSGSYELLYLDEEEGTLKTFGSFSSPDEIACQSFVTPYHVLM